MRKQGLPFPCPDCRETFNSAGAREMHRKAKHRVTVHNFADLAAHRKPYRAEVSLARAVIALIVSLASAAFFAALVRFGFPTLNVPEWAPAAAALIFGMGVGLSILALRPKSVANKQQKSPQKAA